MKLDKAIELLDDFIKDRPSFFREDWKDAIQLGIEALKFTLDIRHSALPLLLGKLPGEDSFIDTTRSEHAIKKVLESPLVRPDGD